MMNSIFTFPNDDFEERSRQWKGGVRVLGVAESFEKKDHISYVVGIIMRGDLRIDGFGFCNPTVGGLDATEHLFMMYERMERKDIHAWMLGGCIISWFNSVDIHQLAAKTGIPVICVSYEASEGLDRYVKEYFPDNWEMRLEAINAIGQRERFTLDSGLEAFIACAGISSGPAKKLVNQFTSEGRIPEPVRVARQLAAEVRKQFAQ
ncbi:MAG: DUF99 family protein [Candidatus Thorarchaeota archaeon]